MDAARFLAVQPIFSAGGRVDGRKARRAAELRMEADGGKRGVDQRRKRMEASKRSKRFTDLRRRRTNAGRMGSEKAVHAVLLTMEPGVHLERAGAGRFRAGGEMCAFGAFNERGAEMDTDAYCISEAGMSVFGFRELRAAARRSCGLKRRSILVSSGKRRRNAACERADHNALGGRSETAGARGVSRQLPRV